jgi:hypothetical protein
MRSYSDIDNYITESSDNDYGEIVKYIEKYGADFQTEVKEEARLFMINNHQLEGGLYLINIDGKYKFIIP